MVLAHRKDILCRQEILGCDAPDLHILAGYPASQIEISHVIIDLCRFDLWMPYGGCANEPLQ